MKNKGRDHFKGTDGMPVGAANCKGFLVALTRPERSMARGKINYYSNPYDNKNPKFYKRKMNKRIRGYQKTSKVQNQYFEEYDWATTYYS